MPRLFFILTIFLSVNLNAKDVYRNGQTSFNFPQSIAGIKVSGTKRFPDPRMGYALRYQFQNKLLITIVVYNGGVGKIKNGLNDPKLLQQMRNSTNAIHYAAKARKYRSVKATNEPSKWGPLFLSSSFSIIGANGATQKDYVLMRAQNNQFIKIRISNALKAPVDAKIKGFISELIKIIGAT